MGKFPKVSDYVDISKIKSDVEAKFNGVVTNAMADLKSGDLDPDKFESKISEYEEKYDKYKVYTDAYNKAKTVAGVLINPEKAAKDLALKVTKDFVMDQLENNAEIQKIKKESMETTKEKLMTIPTVKALKDEVDQKLEPFRNLQTPSDISSLMQNPDKLMGELPSGQRLIDAAKRESGFARTLLGGDSHSEQSL